MKTNLFILISLFATQLFAGLGDLDNDGSITLADCKLLAAAVAEQQLPDLSVADINGDGAVTIIDAMRLHQSIGGLWIEPTGAILPVPQLSDEERSYFAQYEELCDQYDAMSPQAFLDKFPSAPAYTSGLSPEACQYYEEVLSAFPLSQQQLASLQDNGMVIFTSDSTLGNGLGGHYAQIFKKDLPVFVTSDVLLDPLYRLYDNVLKEIESRYLIPTLEEVLSATIGELENTAAIEDADATLTQTVSDAKIYLQVASALLSGETSSSAAEVNSYLELIEAGQLTDVNFFGNTTAIDFSQFTPRGHYECQAHVTNCKLENYFKSMMWLGRADCAFVLDSLRHLRSFALIHKCMEDAGMLEKLSRINQTISMLVGEVDGFSFEGLTKIQSESPIAVESIIASDEYARQLQAKIALEGGGNQLILSQAMWKDPDATRPELPKTGQICGQRFILDSYVLGRTVEWYVKGRNKPLLEEVAFCLGNNAATDVISSDVTTYTQTIAPTYKPYHTRLGAARTLFEEYPYWDQNCYTLWLDALRQLSRPLPNTTPTVLRSHTWQDKQMNTQLTSWAQLRHNTLLYAKQSYTGGISCFYPDGYVEPYPEFYHAIGILIKRIKSVSVMFPEMSSYTLFNADTWIEVTDTLSQIAEREIKGELLTDEDISFLNGMFVKNEDMMCGAPPYNGWYPLLYSSWDECIISKPCIADVHTIPPSAIAPSDMVLHAATGNASYMIIQAATKDDCGTLFVGAVSSFYQHDEQPIKRLTDSDWNSVISGNDKPAVPEWFSSYIH